MCYLDVYSKEGFDMYEDTLIHIHESELKQASFAALPVFFKETNISLMGFFFSPSLPPHTPTLTACFVSIMPSATEVEVAGGCFSTTRLE